MLRFVVRRLLQLTLVVAVLSMLIFVWLRSLPGGPVSAMLGERQTPERRAALEAALGLDQPLPVQYWRFLQRALDGEFGVSTKVLPGEDALDIFLMRSWRSCSRWSSGSPWATSRRAGAEASSTPSR